MPLPLSTLTVFLVIFCRQRHHIFSQVLAAFLAPFASSGLLVPSLLLSIVVLAVSKGLPCVPICSKVGQSRRIIPVSKRAESL